MISEAKEFDITNTFICFCRPVIGQSQIRVNYAVDHFSGIYGRCTTKNKLVYDSTTAGNVSMFPLSIWFNVCYIRICFYILNHDNLCYVILIFRITIENVEKQYVMDAHQRKVHCRTKDMRFQSEFVKNVT